MEDNHMTNDDNMQNVLVVDDIKENIDIIDGLLRREYNIKFATNGKMAVTLTRRFLPDLILMDIMMPVMDGFEATRILKSDPLTSEIPIIFITAKNEDFDEAKGFALGAVDYISKPISPVVLKGRVKTHLSLYNQKKLLARRVNEKTKELLEARLDIIRKLGIAAEYKDNETGNHIIRMSKICYLVAEAYGFEQDKLDLLLHAAPMHDIGKLGIPDKVLQKPGKLNHEEWEIMKSHCAIGAKIIGKTETEIMRASKIVAYEHHEKWNGKGYPEGLVGEDIHIYGRIAAVADVFDALISERPYKNAWPFDDAVKYIVEESRKHFDPDVVIAFVKALPKIKETVKEYS